MALKATIHKVRLQLADMDRNIYGDHELTIARHPSETDERMLMRVLAFALNVPADREHGDLTLAKLVARTMAWQVTVQDGTVWVSDTVNTVEITPKLLKPRDERDQY